MTGMWDKFYALFERIDHKLITPKQLSAYKEYTRLLGEVLRKSDTHMKAESKWLKNFHKLTDPIPILLINLSEKLPESKDQLMEVISELHTFDHKTLLFQGKDVHGHYTEKFIYWMLQSRSKLVPKELRPKAKRLLELERNYDLWNLSNEEMKKV